MRFRKPSPSMAVALAALVMASTGTAVAAVNFARNAGAVDHKSAVSASSGRGHAAGKLVATRAKGGDAGRLPNRFVSNVPFTGTFAHSAAVADNAQGTPFTLGRSRLGTLRASCDDKRAATGVEDPSVTFTFANGTGGSIAFARENGSGGTQVVNVAKGTQASFTINRSNTFSIRVAAGDTDAVYDGQLREDGAGTASASCVLAGVSETVAP